MFYWTVFTNIFNLKWSETDYVCISCQGCHDRTILGFLMNCILHYNLFCFLLEIILYLRIKIFNKDFRASVLQWGFLSNIFNIQLLRKTDLLPLIAVLFQLICLKLYNLFLQHARRYNHYQMHFVYYNILMS